MWATISPIVIAILAAVILLSVAVSIYSDHVLARFRRNPGSVHIDDVCRHIDREGFSLFLLGACGGLIGFILALPAFNERHGLEFIGFVTVVSCIAGLLIKTPFDWIFGPGRGRAPAESLPLDGGGRLLYFAAALPPEPDDEPDDFDTYKVFIAPAMLCGAQVLDDIDETGGFVTSRASSIPETEAMFYDAFDVTSPDFRRLNSDNFQIPWRDIASIACDPVSKRKRIIDAPNSGSITIQPKSGEPRELIVLGKRDVQALRDQLQGLVDSAADSGDLGTPPWDETPK